MNPPYIKKCTSFIVKCLCLLLVVVASLWPCNVNAYELNEWINNKGITGVSTKYNSWSSIQNGYFWQPDGTAHNNYEVPSLTLNSTQSTIEKGSIITLTYTVFSKNNSIPEECLSSRKWDTNLSVVRCDRESFIIDNPDQVDRVMSAMRWDTSSNSGVVNQVLYNNATVADGYSYTVTNFYYYLLTNETRAYDEIVLNGILAHQESTGSQRLILVHFGQVNFFTAQATIDDVIQYMKDHPDTAGQQMEHSRDEAEQAQRNSENNGNQSSQDAQNATQSLMATLQSFLGALSSATPSNCNLPMDTGFINFGVVNLCSLSPPPAFQVISSVVVIGFAVPLAIIAIKQMLSLFALFQR